ncbi:MAG: Gfo/Idh/MocA family oxidoreductase, partial [Opitutae bacterium]|nr:Gfo/Idh/MocA family oxidoreductase [Opitutae bacterium]
MDKKTEKGTPDVSRRQFVQGAAATAGLSTLSFVNHAKAAPAGGSDAIKVCLIGCGGRGSGAVDQILSAPKDLKKDKKIDCETRLVAVADAFPDSSKFRNRLKSLKGRHGDKFQVTEDNIFGGLDGYKAAIDESKADLVVIATPPGFKPQQFEYAINKGKDVFMEKPVASDAAGVRRVLASAKVAKENSQMVGIGLQRRHEERYIDCVKKLQDGIIGDINLLRVYWNGGGIWYRDREPNM